MSDTELEEYATGRPHRQQAPQVSVAELSDDGEVERIIRLCKSFRKTPEEEWDEFRGWLVVLATLTASITYSAALNPPGGVWQADDVAHGYVAGNPVLYDKSPNRFLLFYYSNVTSFMSSLHIIALLSIRGMKAVLFRTFRRELYCLLLMDFVTLSIALVASSSSTPKLVIYNSIYAGTIVIYVIIAVTLVKLRPCMGPVTR